LGAENSVFRYFCCIGCLLTPPNHKNSETQVFSSVSFAAAVKLVSSGQRSSKKLLDLPQMNYFCNNEQTIFSIPLHFAQEDLAATTGGKDLNERVKSRHRGYGFVCTVVSVFAKLMNTRFCVCMKTGLSKRWKKSLKKLMKKLCCLACSYKT